MPDSRANAIAFHVDDLDAAYECYVGTFGLHVIHLDRDAGVMVLYGESTGVICVYSGNTPVRTSPVAVTVEVDDAAAAIDALRARGVETLSGGGPAGDRVAGRSAQDDVLDVAWFRDLAGNLVALRQK